MENAMASLAIDTTTLVDKKSTPLYVTENLIENGTNGHLNRSRTPVPSSLKHIPLADSTDSVFSHKGTYHLVYFNMRGRAELIRLLFIAAQVDFEDHRVEHKDWQALKFHTPSGVLPYMITPEGNVTVQSMAIARTLAHRFSLFGNMSDPDEYYRIERAISQLQDVAEEMFKVVMAEDKKESLKQFFDGTGGSMLRVLEGFLSEVKMSDNNGTTNGTVSKTNTFYSGTSSATIAEIFNVAVVDWFLFNFPGQLADYPLIMNNYHQCLAEFPQIKVYLSKVPKSHI